MSRSLSLSLSICGRMESLRRWDSGRGTDGLGGTHTCGYGLLTLQQIDSKGSFLKDLLEADHFFKKVSLSISLAHAGSDEIRMGAGGRDGDPFLPSFPLFPPFIGIRSSDDQADGADGASE